MERVFLLRENEREEGWEKGRSKEATSARTGFYHPAPLDPRFRFALGWLLSRSFSRGEERRRGGWRDGAEWEWERWRTKRSEKWWGGEGGWTKKGRGKPRATAGAVTRALGVCYRSCRVPPRLRYLYSARTSAIRSFVEASDESSRNDEVGDAGRGHRYKAEEGTSRRIDKKD